MQKLFDSLCSISHDELLLLRTFDSTHLETCETVKAASHGVIASIEEFFPSLKNSKVCFPHPSFHISLNTCSCSILISILWQKLLDNILLELPTPRDLFVFSKKMEGLVFDNFKILEEFKKHLALHNDDMDRSLVKETLLGHFEEVLKKVFFLFLRLGLCHYFGLKFGRP